MRWIKVAAIVGGALIVFFVVDSLVHLLFGVLTTIVFLALVAGGVAVAVKIAGARKRHVEGRREEHQVREEPTRQIVAAPPPSPVRKADVDDELARLKREMGA